MRATRIVLDSAAFKHNLALLKAANGSAFFCPMIKANAYGHGMLELAPLVAACGADAAGVAMVEEGAQLRLSGFPLPILVFAPLEQGDGELMREFKLTPVVTRFEDLDIAKKSGIPAHIKFNTGMQRLGFDEEQVPELRERIKSSGLQVAGVCTHLTHGEDVHDKSGPTAGQFEKFLSMGQGFPGVKHAHKSATLADCLLRRLSKVHPEVGARPGIAIYGLPHDGNSAGQGLQPVLSLRTKLSRVHTVEKGAHVSYGARWTAARRSVIGVVPFGYGDGYSRLLSNKGHMLFRGVKVPVAGSVCMDYVLLDLTDACKDGAPKAGEEIMVIGRQNGSAITAYDLASLTGTIAYEVVTALSARVAREVQ